MRRKQISFMYICVIIGFFLSSLAPNASQVPNYIFPNEAHAHGEIGGGVSEMVADASGVRGNLVVRNYVNAWLSISVIGTNGASVTTDDIFANFGVLPPEGIVTYHGNFTQIGQTVAVQAQYDYKACLWNIADTILSLIPGISGLDQSALGNTLNALKGLSAIQKAASELNAIDDWSSVPTHVLKAVWELRKLATEKQQAAALREILARVGIYIGIDQLEDLLVVFEIYDQLRRIAHTLVFAIVAPDGASIIFEAEYSGAPSTPISPPPPPPPPPPPGACSAPPLLEPDESATLNSRTVTFRWQAPNCSILNGYTFRLNRSSNPDDQPWIKDTGLGTQHTDYTWTFDQDGTYYWHMRSWSTSNQPSVWVSRRFVISTSAPPPPTDGIELCDGINYSGPCQTFTEGQYPNLGSLDRKASSLRYWGSYVGNYHVTLYDDYNLGGQPGHFDADWADLGSGGSGWSNRARSMKIERYQPPPPPPSSGIILCSDPDYKGTCKNFTSDDPNLHDDGLGNSVSSVKFYGNYCLDLYDNTDYNGQKGTFQWDIPNLAPHNWDNRAESFKLRACDPLPCDVKLCSDTNYGGTCKTFHSDDSDLHDDGLGNSVSSLDLKDGCLIYLYDNTNYQGQRGTFEQDVPDLHIHNWGDRAESFELRPKGPGSPSNLSANAVSPWQINLSWSAASGVIDGYKIFRNGSQIAQVSSGTTSYQDKGLACGTSYSYYVTAFNAGGESGPSNTVNPTTQSCPPDGVTLCTDSYYEGTCKSFSADDPDLSNDGLDNNVSSLRINGYRIVDLYDYATYGGETASFQQDVPNLHDFGWGDRVGSFKLRGSDATPPTGQITYPGSDSYFSTNSIPIYAEASDSGSGVDKVEFHAAWPSWHHLGDDSTAPYSLNWDCSGVPDGGVWLTIHIIDKAGNETMDPGGYVYVILDRTLPSSSINTLLATQSNKSFTVSWSGSDSPAEVASETASEIASYDVQYMAAGWWGWYDWLLGTTSTSAAFDNALDGHTYYFRCRARDKAGNYEDYPIDSDTSTTIQTCGTATADAYEQDNTYTAATMIGVEATQRHNFHVTDDQDWVKFEATAGMTYTIQTALVDADCDTYAFLYDTDGTTLLAENDDTEPGVNRASRIEGWVAPANGTYYVMVRHWNAQAGGCGTNYDLSVLKGEGSGRVYLPSIMKSYDPTKVTPTPTNTPVNPPKPTNTPTNTPTGTLTPTNAPTPTNTPTNTPTPTQTPTPTPHPLFGDGSDGDLTVSGTVYVDDVRSALSSSASAGQPQVQLANTSGFAAGQRILLHQTQGTGAGAYEMGTIASVESGSGIVTLEENLQSTYTVGGNSKAQAIRVPQFRNVTVQSGGILTAHAWDGTTGGILAFLATGTVTVNGTILADYKGFRASTTTVNGNNQSQYCGEGSKYASYATRGPTGGSEGGGGENESGSAQNDIVRGAGGGNGTKGQDGYKDNNPFPAHGGSTSGTADLTNMTFGGAGGHGAHNWQDSGAKRGGNGGGIVYITGVTLTMGTNGSITANGEDAYYAGVDPFGVGGGGAGGSILLKVQTATLGTNKITATGGTSDEQPSGYGDGGDGRIRIEACSVSGTTNPPASVVEGGHDFCP